jgi:hypothetical protein
VPLLGSSALWTPPKKRIITPATGGGGGGGGGGYNLLNWPGSPRYETYFPGTSLPTGWTPGRYASSTFTSNEATNIPSQQLDSSWGGNVSVNNGLYMASSAQVNTALFPDKPFCGSHVSYYGTVDLLIPGSYVEIECQISRHGATWPAGVWYAKDGSGGEIDQWEIGNAWDNRTATFNTHKADYSAQDQSTYNGSPPIAGDGVTHIFHMTYGTDYKLTPYLDGSQCGYTRDALEHKIYSLFFELGVYRYSSLGTAAMNSYGTELFIPRISVW